MGRETGLVLKSGDEAVRRPVVYNSDSVSMRKMVERLQRFRRGRRRMRAWRRTEVADVTRARLPCLCGSALTQDAGLPEMKPSSGKSCTGRGEWTEGAQTAVSSSREVVVERWFGPGFDLGRSERSSLRKVVYQKKNVADASPSLYV